VTGPVAFCTTRRRLVARQCGAHPPPPAPVAPPKLSFAARVQRKLRSLANRG